MTIIKQVNAAAILTVRQAVLRQGLPIEASIFDKDEDRHTAHFGAFIGDTVIGCASLVRNTHARFSPEFTQIAQLRGMAVLPGHRDSGIGGLLLRGVETKATEDGIEVLWFNARIKAVPFYEKNGYIKEGDAYEIEGVGTHYFMFKILSSHE
ncbi:MAG: GNAT family N-acetyltransferase [Flavobacteriaceae bacterium]